jgi:hypothetical protein
MVPVVIMASGRIVTAIAMTVVARIVMAAMSTGTKNNGVTVTGKAKTSSVCWRRKCDE